MKKFFIFLGKTLSFIGVTLAGIVIALLLIINMFCNGSSEKAKDMFVTTILETGQVKFIVNWFLSSDEIKEIVKRNSLKEMKTEVDTNLINVQDKTDQEPIVIEEVNGGTFRGKMMIIADPSKVYVATTYPWSEYGQELGELVKKSGAIGGVNGGLYVSTANKGGYPIGVVVSKGKILHNNTGGYAGLYLIGLDNNNLLRIIDVTKKSKDAVEKIVNDEGEYKKFKENYLDKLILN